MKKLIFTLTTVAIFISSTLIAQKVRTLGVTNEIIAGPAKPSEQKLWLDTLERWRTIEKQKLNYNDQEYKRPELAWIKSTYVYAQMMAHDRYFYDPATGKYTVNRYLNDLEKRYGGLDAVLIWPTYPNIGVDNRNQFDLVADMPGGRDGLRQMIKDFHKRGVKVFFPIMIWDNGTRKPKEPISKTIIDEMKDLGADGLNGDTMTGVTKDFFENYTAVNYPVALQPEVNLNDLKMLEWNLVSWGYFFPDWGVLKYNYVPGVSVYKWLEPRHQVQVTDRWAIDKTEDLQYAFFNGVGYNAWENIWGIWNQVPDRYAAVIRRIRMIYRQFPDAWNSPDWQPHVPVVQSGVFASRFPSETETVYTLINRDSIQKTGSQIKLPYKKGYNYFDLWNGVQLNPEKGEDNTISLAFTIDANGYGSILELQNGKQPVNMSSFLSLIRQQAHTPLEKLAVDWKPLKQTMVPSPETKLRTSTPDGMILIPPASKYNFETKGVMIEGDELPEAVGVQYPWDTHPMRNHKKKIDIKAFYIDKYPVTNKQYKQFMMATKYRPKDDHNFLKDWKNNNYPAGWDSRPVTWVSLDDARAYAAWAGKRLPHEWEWQYAAQGTDGRLYPWGAKRDTLKIPPADTTRNMREPTLVDAYPEGASPFGVMDLTGNVWQWTDEYVDDHTRSAILKGGSYYHPQTAGWYFPQAQEADKYAKYLLMSPGMDRSGTIGFRCVADK
jgi:iron(II)-dependent oxidoreductase